MHEGRMYFDNDSKKTLAQKVQGAVDSYIKKYGANPNLCFAHPSAFDKDTKQISVGSVTVRPYRPVLPNSLWIGMEDKS
jgi:hypothetical protein